jgi:C-methyltransferase C-terminal domain
VSIEVPHVLALIDQVQFDTIYHEHYAYWSLHAMRAVLARHGLLVYAVEILPTHGTSLRVLASADAGADQCHGSAALGQVEAQEARAGLGTPGPYRNFEPKMRDVVAAFRDYLGTAQAAGRRVAAYGAAAKGNTFLNAGGATCNDIAMIADRNPAKQGKLLPGSRIPIVGPDQVLAYRPDDVLILPWNLADEIAGALDAVRGWGGRLLVASPRLREIA